MTPKDFQQTRTALGLSQQHLADLMSVSLRTVSRWETGETALPGPAILALDLLSQVEGTTLEARYLST
jgi:DNA-binding transcriptional regulator YiaG